MKVAITAATITLMILMPLAAAQETGLLTPTTTPDNPLYGLNRAIEGVQLFFTFNDLDKAKLHYQFAEDRLAEAQTMADEGKTQLAQNALQDYKNELNQTDQSLESAVATNENVTGLVNEISDRSVLHIQVMKNIHDKVSTSAQQDIDKDISASLAAQATAVRFVSRTDIVNMTITVGDRTITVQVPQSMAENIVNRVQNLSEKEDITIENVQVTTDKIEAKITECQNLIDNLQGKQLDTAGTILLGEAQTHLDNASSALNESKFGMAVGQTVAACSIVNNAAKHMIEQETNESGSSSTMAGGGAGPGVKNATPTISGGGPGPGGY